MVHTYIWFDIGYTCIIEPQSSHVCVQLWKILDRIAALPLYEAFEEHGNLTHDLSLAPSVAKGIVKWEGCSNWDFEQPGNVMVHFCGKKEIDDFGAALSRIYDAAKVLNNSIDAGSQQ